MQIIIQICMQIDDDNNNFNSNFLNKMLIYFIKLYLYNWDKIMLVIKKKKKKIYFNLL